MNKENIFDYILSELQKHRCVMITVKNGFFPKWQSERGNFICKGIHNNENVREILPNEIIMEFDEIGNNPIEKVQEESEKWINETKSWLKKNDYSFYITNHNGKSSHVRFQIGGLEKFDFETRKKYKQSLTKQILNEIKFDSNILKLDESLINTKNKLLSLELQPHFKSKYKNALENIIYINWKKVNQIDSVRLQDIKQEQSKDKKQQNNSPSINLEKIKEYFEENYVEGNRNNLILAFGGMLNHKGFSIDDAEEMLEEILDYIDADDFKERRNEIKYCFNSEKNISIRHWINEIYSDLSADEQEQKYQEFKLIFEFLDENFVQVKSGKFFIEIKDELTYLKFVDDKTKTVSSKALTHFDTLNKFKRFNTENEIDLGNEKPSEVFSKINKLNNVIKVNKGNVKNMLDSFFVETEFYDNNQLFYNGEFAYTMCNGEHTLLTTFNQIKIIDDDFSFQKLSKIRSNLISPSGLKRLKEKNVNENIFEDVKNLLNDYLDYEEEDLILTTLWVFHTYFFNVQGSTVYLHFTGMPGTGKSTGQKVLNKICWNSDYVCNLSESSLFREIDSLQNTLHIDEIDKWAKEKQEQMQGLLNNGYSQGGSVKRSSGKDGNFKVERFRVFSPKTLTSNNPMFLDSFKTRCIDIIPQRTIRNLKNIDVVSDFEKKRFIQIRDDIYIYMLKYGSDIFNIFKKEISNPTRISNRENQLLSVIDCFNVHFKLNLDLNNMFENRRDEVEWEFDHYYLILKAMSKKIDNDMCIVSTKDLAKELNETIYGENVLSYKLNSIKIGFKMKNLGFRQYKKQILNGERYHHYEIPKKAIEKKIIGMGYDIKF